MDLLELISKLYNFNYSVVSEDSNLASVVMRDSLNFKILKVPSGKEVNGWKIPPEWSLKSARISDEIGNEIWSARKDSLDVAFLSPSVRVSITGLELKTHLLYSEDVPNGIPYGWTNLYRPGEKDWFFSVKKDFYYKIQDNVLYNVDLKTTEKPGDMIIYEFDVKGQSNEYFIFNAHNCHPFQANDDISGVAVLIQFFQYLQKCPNLKKSYKLLISPELFGPVFWLNDHFNGGDDCKGCILLKAVGNADPLKIQSSFDSNTFIDKALQKATKDIAGNFTLGKYREIYGNDETAFDSPGYSIPTTTLTRYPFEYYHTSEDTPEKLSEKNLSEISKILKEFSYIVENNSKFTNKIKGLISLSNPRYNLYKRAYSPGVDKKGFTNLDRQWNLLMNNAPNEIARGMDLLDMSIKYSIPFRLAHDYFNNWVEKGLLKIVI